jgi:hypothetical protein
MPREHASRCGTAVFEFRGLDSAKVCRGGKPCHLTHRRSTHRADNATGITGH